MLLLYTGEILNKDDISFPVTAQTPHLLTLSFIMLKNGQAYFKNLAVFNMFGHFSTL